MMCLQQILRFLTLPIVVLSSLVCFAVDSPTPTQIYDQQCGKNRPLLKTLTKQAEAAKSNRECYRIYQKMSAISYNMPEEIDIITKRLQLAEQLRNNTYVLDCYLGFCRVYSEQDNRQKVQQWAAKIYANSKPGSYHWLMANYYEIGVAFWTGDMRSAWSQLQRLGLDVKRHNSPLGQAIVSLTTAEIYSFTSQDNKAAEMVDSYLETLIEQNDPRLLMLSFSSAVSYQFFIGDYKQAKYYLQRWEKEAQKLLAKTEIPEQMRENLWNIEMNKSIILSYDEKFAKMDDALIKLWDNHYVPSKWDLAQFLLIRANSNYHNGNVKSVEADINYLLQNKDRFTHEYLALLAHTYLSAGMFQQSALTLKKATDVLRGDLNENLLREISQYGQLSKQLSKDAENDDARLRDAHTLHVALIVAVAIIAFAVLVLVVILYRNIKKTRRLQKLNADLKIKRVQISRLNTSLVNAIAEEEESNRKKNEFMANISHEIRTPLNAIVGFSEILSTSIVGEEEFDNREFTELIRSNSDLMLKLVNQIIDTTNDTAVDVNLEKTNVVEVAEKVLYSTEALVHEGVKVVFECHEKSIDIYTDRFRLQQLLTNLLGNAAKFTKQGSITLSINLDSNFVTFSVTDTGCGIKPGKEDSIFGQFEKADEASQGSGLGLYISRTISRTLLGELFVDKTYTNGARFVFQHPTNLEQQIERKEAKA
ncbi:MAG: sensor histidine kinase [Muribaculaceae bacterium]